MKFQPNEGANGEPDVVSLDDSFSGLASLDEAILLDRAVVLLDPCPKNPKRFQIRCVHLLGVARPGSHVRACAVSLKHANGSEAGEMNQDAGVIGHELMNLHGHTLDRGDLSIALEASEEGPLQPTDELEIPQGGIPTIEDHHLWPEAPFVGVLQHVVEVVVLALSISLLVVEPVIDGDGHLAVGP